MIGAEPQLLSKRLNFFSCILQSYLPGLAADTRVEGSYFKSKDFHKRIGSTNLQSCCPHRLCDQQRQKCRWLSFLRVRSLRTDGDDCCVKTFEKCRICTCVFYHLDIGDNDSWLQHCTTSSADWICPRKGISLSQINCVGYFLLACQFHSSKLMSENLVVSDSISVDPQFWHFLADIARPAVTLSEKLKIMWISQVGSKSICWRFCRNKLQT